MSVRDPHFSPKQIAESLEVSESSIKRWCDRGLIPTFRTLGGHRRISAEALSKFLRDSDRELRRPELLGIPQVQRLVHVDLPGDPSAEKAAFREALIAGDDENCFEIIQTQIEKGYSIAKTAASFITDAMYGIGEAWNCNQLEIYQERVACGICARLVAKLRDSFTIGKTARRAIGAAPEGDHYELPTALVELALRERGWNAINLGCNLPFDSILEAASNHRPDLVWLSITAMNDAESFAKAQRKFACELDGRIALIVGGRALTDQVRPNLVYTAHCDSIDQLTELASMMNR